MSPLKRIDLGTFQHLGAAWVVTGDQDLLVIETPLPVRILTAGEALLKVGFCYG